MKNFKWYTFFFAVCLSCMSIASCGSDSSEEPVTPEQERMNFFNRLYSLVENEGNLDEVFKLYGESSSTNSLKFYDVEGHDYLTEPSDTLLLFELNGNNLWIGAFDAGSTEKYYELVDDDIPTSFSVDAGYGETNAYELNNVQVGEFRLAPSALGSDKYIFDVTFQYGSNYDIKVAHTYFYMKGNVSKCCGNLQGYWFDEDYLWIKDVDNETTAMLSGKGTSAQAPYIYIYDNKGKQIFSLTKDDVDSYTVTTPRGCHSYINEDDFFDYVKKGISYDAAENILCFNLSANDGITINVETEYNYNFTVEPIYIERFSYEQKKMSLLWRNTDIPQFTGFAVPHWSWDDGITKFVTVKDKHYVSVVDYTEPKLKFKIENLAYDGTRTDSIYTVNIESGELLK